jgi:predicted TIM-barrel fold metal-dependent hydrolase
VVFATDTPLGPIKPTIEVIDRLGLSDADRRKVYVGNAEKLLRKKLAS